MLVSFSGTKMTRSAIKIMTKLMTYIAGFMRLLFARTDNLFKNNFIGTSTS